MPPLKPDTLLQLAPQTEVRFRSPADMEIRLQGNPVYSGPSTLAILDAFSRPVTFSTGLARLRARIAGVQDWIQCANTVQLFYETGILIGEERVERTWKASRWGFDAAQIHISMLDDRARTSSYLAAIAEVVRPGDVVVDIGTGTGVLAIAAARAGARHVYAIEMGEVGRLAEANFATNGLEDRITLIRGNSTEISLPEPADVLVAELIGSNPLGENVLEVTADAVRRLLKPDARLVPSALAIYGLPVTVPSATLSRHFVTPDSVGRWLEWYGIDFHALVEASRQTRSTSHLYKPQKIRDWPAIGEPVLLAEIDLRTDQGGVLDRTCTGIAGSSGELNGIATSFELQLGPGTFLSTHPGTADETNHWLNQVWIFPEALPLNAGDRFEVTYRHRVPGKENGVEISRA